jgi:hypothetical protein
MLTRPIAVVSVARVGYIIRDGVAGTTRILEKHQIWPGVVQADGLLADYEGCG